jgi:flagellar protein FliO/FliZ
LVLAAIAAVAWAAKRLNPAQTGSGGPGSALRVISATAVGQRERVVLVEVGATWLVVGVAPGQVSSLHSMPRPDIVPGSSDTRTPDNKFSAWLKQTMDRRTNG